MSRASWAFGYVLLMNGCTTAPSEDGGSQPVAGISGATGAGAAGSTGAASGGMAGRTMATAGGVGPIDSAVAGGGGTHASGGAAGTGAGGAADGLAGDAAQGPAGAGGERTDPLGPVAIYLAGDSTVSTYADTSSPQDQAGWGQMLPEYVDDSVVIYNRALGGRTSRRFVEEGHLGDILASIEAGDYLFVQFGTNDSNKTATYTLNGQSVPYYLDPTTDFKSYLRKYIEGARDRHAIPVLVTPPPRSSAYCTGGNGTGSYAAAMRELGQADSVAVVDLNTKTVDHLKAICPAPTPEDFFLVKPDGAVDGTHFQERGARILAGFVASGIRDAMLPLARYLQ